MKDLKKLLFSKESSANGLCSVCTSNYEVLKSSLRYAKEHKMVIIIESTCNQVNQFGGYTNMKPIDYVNFLNEIIDEVNFNKDYLILGGDHLGPNPFKNLDEVQAMKDASDLVREYVLAGYEKIHLDCSMRLKSDSRHEKLSNEVISDRTIQLMNVAEEAYKSLLKKNKQANHPYYIVGSEVPVPGGSLEVVNDVEVTKASDFEDFHYHLFHKLYRLGMSEYADYIIGFVIQPGVEFSDKDIMEFKAENTIDLNKSLKKYDSLVFEGHSTDYQTKECLREMCNNNIKILKVGPQLTYAFREALFALDMIEKELIEENRRSNFVDNLIKAMKSNKKYYEDYYVDNEEFQVKFSLLDRCRYYFNDEKVVKSLNKLYANLSNLNIDNSLISQYLPRQYDKIRKGLISNSVEDLIYGKISDVLSSYDYATKAKLK